MAIDIFKTGALQLALVRAGLMTKKEYKNYKYWAKIKEDMAFRKKFKIKKEVRNGYTNKVVKVDTSKPVVGVRSNPSNNKIAQGNSNGSSQYLVSHNTI